MDNEMNSLYDREILDELDKFAQTAAELMNRGGQDEAREYLEDICASVEPPTTIDLFFNALVNGYRMFGEYGISLRRIEQWSHFCSDKDLIDLLKTEIMAEQGDADAQLHLGDAYFKGEGVEKDLAEAVIWYRKAADQGVAIAQNSLGDCYRYRYGVGRHNFTEAVKWYRKAAEQGNVNAQKNLGGLYYKGVGSIKKDLKEAAKWYRMAAEQGDVGAQYFLGNAYYYGLGVDKDLAESEKWYCRAAEQGNAEAQEKLEDTEILHIKAANQGGSDEQKNVETAAKEDAAEPVMQDGKNTEQNDIQSGQTAQVSQNVDTIPGTQESVQEAEKQTSEEESGKTGDEESNADDWGTLDEMDKIAQTAAELMNRGRYNEAKKYLEEFCTSAERNRKITIPDFFGALILGYWQIGKYDTCLERVDQCFYFLPKEGWLNLVKTEILVDKACQLTKDSEIVKLLRLAVDEAMNGAKKAGSVNDKLTKGNCLGWAALCKLCLNENVKDVIELAQRSISLCESVGEKPTAAELTLDLIKENHYKMTPSEALQSFDNKAYGKGKVIRNVPKESVR